MIWRRTLTEAVMDLVALEDNAEEFDMIKAFCLGIIATCTMVNLIILLSRR